MSSPGFVLTRRLASIGLVMLGLGAVLATVAGEMLTRPARATAPVVPTGLQAHFVSIPVPGGTVAGWLAAGEPGKGAVLLLHGVRSSRLQMLGRAQFLHAAGYTALLIDLPAHGESTGTRITFGATESSAIRATLKYLQQSAPGEKVAVVGVSLGAASLVLGGAVPVPAAVVVESMYPTLREAVANRLEMRLGPPGRLLAGPLLWQLPLRLGLTESDMRPIDRIASLAAPIAVASGTQDEHTTWPETLRLFTAAAGPKELWPFEGAAHVDLHRYAPKLYEQRLLAFLARHLRNEVSRQEADGRPADMPYTPDAARSAARRLYRRTGRSRLSGGM